MAAVQQGKGRSEKIVLVGFSRMEMVEIEWDMY